MDSFKVTANILQSFATALGNLAVLNISTTYFPIERITKDLDSPSQCTAGVFFGMPGINAHARTEGEKRWKTINCSAPSITNNHAKVFAYHRHQRKEGKYKLHGIREKKREKKAPWQVAREPATNQPLRKIAAWINASIDQELVEELMDVKAREVISLSGSTIALAFFQKLIMTKSLSTIAPVIAILKLFQPCNIQLFMHPQVFLKYRQKHPAQQSQALNQS